MKTECGKIPYATRDKAVAALANSRERFKKRGVGDKSWRRLHVYQCSICEGHPFHLGRCWRPMKAETEVQSLKKPPTPKPAPKSPSQKIPSVGELRRKLKRIDNQLARELKHRLYVQGQIIAADNRRDYEAALAAIGITSENGR
jgi:hypothetical protein